MSPEVKPYPLDPFLGIARPVFVTPEHFPDGNPYGPHTHFHHLNFEDGREELKTELGRALRYSAGQRLPATMHFNIYPGSVHRLLRQPEGLPTTAEGLNRSAMLHVGHVVSRTAVELSDGAYTDRILSDEEHAYLSEPYITYIENGHKKRSIFTDHRVGQAFVEYAIERYFLEVVTQKQAEQFIKARRSKDIPRRMELGNLLIRNALDESILSVQPYYDLAKEKGMVAPNKPSLRASVRKLIPEHEFGTYYRHMEKRLRSPQIQKAETLQVAVSGSKRAA